MFSVLSVFIPAKLKNSSECSSVVFVFLPPSNKPGASPVFCTPTLDKGDADGTHPGELVHGLKALAHTLGQLVCKLLVVEDLQVTS